jgi:hypothetical protein
VANVYQDASLRTGYRSLNSCLHKPYLRSTECLPIFARLRTPMADEPLSRAYFLYLTVFVQDAYGSLDLRFYKKNWEHSGTCQLPGRSVNGDVDFENECVCNMRPIVLLTPPRLLAVTLNWSRLFPETSTLSSTRAKQFCVQMEGSPAYAYS